MKCDQVIKLCGPKLDTKSIASYYHIILKVVLVLSFYWNSAGEKYFCMGKAMEQYRPKAL